VPIEVRAEVLRPALERLEADILCLQEVNAQHVAGHDQRSLTELDQLLAGTRYADYARATIEGRQPHARTRGFSRLIHDLSRSLID
jgi:endonuclease/exonuclease/phosphatase family metal-dependent hydrolase